MIKKLKDYNKMKASDLLVKALENEGVEYVFGVPGEENLDLLESLRTSKIKLIVTRHEQAAGFMAATYGRLTGKAGVALSTLGPGATNLVTAAAYAQLGAMPFLMITGQKPIKRSKQGHFQIVDIPNLMKPVTKFATQIVDANRIPPLVREAFATAQEERPGAVLLELPEDIAAEETSAETFTVNHPRRPIAESKAVAQAVEMIEQAKHPLILVGAGANRKRVSKMLTELLEKTSIMFINTPMGKGVIDERSSNYVGTAALLSGDDFVHRAVEHADLIINIGHDIIENPPFIMKRDGARVIHINFFSAKVDNVYFPQHEVVGDIANALWQIKEKITAQQSWDFSFFQKVRERLNKQLLNEVNDTNLPLKPQRIVHDIRAAMPDDGIVTLDNGMYKIWFARYYPTYNPNTLLLDNALATMGAGMPSAIGARLVYPDTKVLAVVGDGGFMMNSQELETAVRLKIDLVVVVINDSGFGMIQWKQRRKGFSDFGLDYNNPDFVQYAESYGAKGHRVKRAADLREILQEALSSPGVHLIDVPIDYSENEKVLNNLRALTKGL